jgi:hypothetical protein
MESRVKVSCSRGQAQPKHTVHAFTHVKACTPCVNPASNNTALYRELIALPGL